MANAIPSRTHQCPYCPMGADNPTKEQFDAHMKTHKKHSPNTGEKCPHCNFNISLRNPSGECDHLFYPENCDICKETKPSQQECGNCKNPAPNKWIAIDVKGNCAECGAELEGKRLFTPQQEMCKKCGHHGLRHSDGKKHACHIIDCKCKSFQPPKSSEPYIGTPTTTSTGTYFPPQKEGWEQEFDSEFDSLCCGGDFCDYNCAENTSKDIKAFIKSLLKEERERIKKELLEVIEKV